MINYCKVDLNLIITHFVYLSIRHSGFIYFYWFIGIVLLIGLGIGGGDDRAEILNNAWDSYPIYLRCLMNSFPWCSSVCWTCFSPNLELVVEMIELKCQSIHQMIAPFWSVVLVEQWMRIYLLLHVCLYDLPTAFPGGSVNSRIPVSWWHHPSLCCVSGGG